MQITTIRVTKVQQAFKPGEIRFRGVPVNERTHAKVSANNYYYVTISESKMPMFPVEGQIWKIIDGESVVTEKSSFSGRYVEKHHAISDAGEFSCILPKSCRSFIEFIARDKKAFKGIGSAKAEALWNTFGSRIFKILEEKDTKILTEILTSKAASNMVAGYEKYGYLKYASMLTSKGIPLTVQHRIFRFERRERDFRKDIKGNSYSVNPLDIIKNNPYLLHTSFGLSFTETDKIAAAHYDIQPTDSRRLIAAVTAVLKLRTQQHGHTIASPHQLKPALKVLLGGDQKMAEMALQSGYDQAAFIIYQPSGYYQRTPIYVMENVVALRLLKLNSAFNRFVNSQPVEKACNIAFTRLLPKKLNDRQREAVLTSTSHAVSGITGGAGTGKTFVLNTVLTVYQTLGYTIKAMALSGRAAMRLHQSIGIATSTIAKFIKEPPIDKPLNDEKYLVVIDEASMIDLATMYRIVCHTDPAVRYLFVGDPNQLPPIGCGNVFSDIVNSGVIPLTELDIVRRQEESSGIPEYTKLINEGIAPPSLSTGHITFHDTSYDAVTQQCVELYAQSPENSRVIAPTNALVRSINTACQTEVNNAGKRLTYTDEDGQWYWEPLYKNDPVLFNKNNYDAGIQNGSLGQLISVEQTDKQLGAVQLDDSGEVIQLTPTLLLELTQGYAITLHKAQGSQFTRCIIGLTAGVNVDRAWLYTAITRAEEEVHIVGPREKVLSAIRHISNASRRMTTLQTLLQQGQQYT
jgi:exodeoxyribonuclease V alpha subunit